MMACRLMTTSSNGNIFRVTGHLCGEFTGPGDFPHKSQWRRVLMFSLICTRINGWVNNGEAGDLRRNRTHYDVTVMYSPLCLNLNQFKLLLNGSLGTNFGGIWIKMRLFYGQEDAFGNVVCKTATILSRPQCAILQIFEGNTHEQIWIIILWSTKE